jgi:hypothetical protein
VNSNAKVRGLVYKNDLYTKQGNGGSTEGERKGERLGSKKTEFSAGN